MIMWWKILLILFAAFIVITLIRAIFYKPKRFDGVKIEDVDIDEMKVAEHLSQAIQCKTISRSDPDETDWSEFEKFHKFLDEAYPLIKQNTVKEKISRASLIYRWKGKTPSLSLWHCFPTRMLSLSPRARKKTGRTTPSAATLTAKSSGVAVLLI